jgi:hypothetical protein
LSLGLPRQPEDDPPELPRDLSDLNDRELIDLLTEINRWADYSGGQLALAESDERSLEFAKAQAENAALVRNYGGGRDSVQAAKAARSSDPLVLEAERKLLFAYALRKVLNARHEAFERDAFAVSRELTRRLGRDPVERRTNRYGGGR